MESRDNREPIMRALYGLGCATSSSIIRIGKISGGKIGIFPIDDYQYTLSYREKGSAKIIKSLFNYGHGNEKRN